MSYRLLFDRARRVIVVRFGPSLTEPTLTAMRTAVRDFIAREPGCRAIVDFTAVEEAKIPGHFVAELARSGPIVKGEMRVLVAPKPEIFGLSRMYELHQHTTADHTRVVRTLAEARALLGVDALELEEIG
jgi:hypothetical protein